MRLRRLLVAIVLAFLATESTSAADNASFVVPPILILKSAARKFQKWGHPLQCRSGHLRTVISVSNLQESAPFGSGAVIGLIALNKSTARLSLQAEHPGQLLSMFVQFWSPEGQENTQTFSQKYKLGEEVPVEIFWTPHEINYVVGEDRKSIKIEDPTPIFFMAVGSVVKFDRNLLECNLTS